MRFDGILTSWNEERGFGFIKPAQGGEDVFVHINAIPTALRPPKVGQAFNFEVGLNREGKKRAANLGIPQARRSARRRENEQPARWSVASAVAIPLFVLVFLLVAMFWQVSAWVAVAYVVLSIASVAAYAVDKSAARGRRWRVSERSLLLLGLVGGWPGSIIAQQALRHKTSKVSFRSAFWFTVLLNVAGFVFLHSPLAQVLHA